MVILTPNEIAISRQTKYYNPKMETTKLLDDRTSVEAGDMKTDTYNCIDTAKEGTAEMKEFNSNLKMVPKNSKVPLNSVIPFITCKLCKGYLIDATTIVECLHTFCHSCIMIHLRHKQYCPCCELMINQTRPNIKSDAIRQAIVYKLVPGLYERELLRRQEFYRCHPNEAKLATPEQRGEDTENLIFSPTEKISLSIEYADPENVKELDKDLQSPKYLLCPASFTINMLSKFVLMKFGIDITRFMVDISYKVRNVVLADNYTLMDVAYIYTWKRETPMRFYFRVRAKDTKDDQKAPLHKSLDIISKSEANGILIENKCLKPSPNSETKLKLIKKVNDNEPFNDKKRVVYMVQCPPLEHIPAVSPASEYAFTDSTVGGDETTLRSAAQPNTIASAPKYRSLVEKENAKMKKLMQSLSEEKKRLKMQKRQVSKLVTMPEKKCDSIKLKISKTEAGVLVIQNSVDSKQPELKDPIDIIGNVVNCDRNDNFKKSLFLNTFQLTAKKSSHLDDLQVPLQPRAKDVCGTQTINVLNKDRGIDRKDSKLVDDNIASSLKIPSPAKSLSPLSTQIMPPAMVKPKFSLKRNLPEDKLGQNIPRKKNSSYVKIAPKDGLSAVTPRVNLTQGGPTSISQPSSAATTTPRLVPLQDKNGPQGSGIAAVPKKKLQYKPPLFNMTGFSHTQFQTMPSPIYVTNINAGSTPIYSPNSPQYSVNFPLPHSNEFKYTKLPSYVTNIGGASNSSSTRNLLCGNLITSTPKSGIGKPGQHMNRIPLPPTFNSSSGMSITTTTTQVPVKLPGSNMECSGNQGKRKNAPASDTVTEMGSRIISNLNSSITTNHNDCPPEKQRKVESLLHSCNITFPSSLSITIANENDDQKSPGTYTKLKNPVNNYIEILKIPSDDNQKLSSNKDSLKSLMPLVTATNNIKRMESGSVTLNKLPTPTSSVSSTNVGYGSQINPTTGSILNSARVNAQCSAIQGQRMNSPMTSSVSTIDQSTNQTKQDRATNKKLMPKLNPIDKTANPKQNSVALIGSSISPSHAEKKQGNLSTDTNAMSKETFQVEYLKFANDNHPVSSVSSKKLNKPSETSEGKQVAKGNHNNHKKLQNVAKSPNIPKLQVINDNNNKRVSSCASKGNTSLHQPVPTPSREQEYAATLMKMALGLQQQQRLAALQQPSFDAANLMLPKPGVSRATSQSPPNQQFNSLIQQACLIEHFERMKRAGKEALERYSQQIEPKNKPTSHNEKTAMVNSKPSIAEKFVSNEVEKTKVCPPLSILPQSQKIQKQHTNNIS